MTQTIFRLHPVMLPMSSIRTMFKRVASSAGISGYPTTTSRSIVTAALTAAEAASQLQHTLVNKPVVRKQILDGNQLQKLSLTLGRAKLWPDMDVSRGTAPPVGTPLPPGYHLVYFTPSELEIDLGADGSDRVFNPPAPFTRRMWAGGRIQWPDLPLRVGERVEEVTRLVSATVKRRRADVGSEMILVEVEKQFWGERGLSIVDQRSWIFQRARDPLSSPSSTTATTQPLTSIRTATYPKSSAQDLPSPDDPDGPPERHLVWSPAGLFRFSALTFNAHMIHYNDPWTRQVEGHPAVVVHGPLNLICMLDYWRDNLQSSGQQAREVLYRATAPVYAEEAYRITAADTPAGGPASSLDRVAGRGEVRHEVLVKKGEVVCMRGDIISTNDPDI
ncbi:hypothetical protein QBC47DRAFT_374243 [Echria macrotheca]|uniref:Mesaconyl-C4 CoA hydratase n=1 Tax=Echria macrotheca TaxID=438768 RepID=A0AAJ0BHD4_9PEZI|nr:hypothetical protein QBC47DRAFT_374243 [Echria macrotheca]